jgi:phosphatidylinositol alpha-1,6-mannosyltransferase
MKILLITFEFPPQGGGIGTYAYQIALNLNKLGLNVHVFAHSNYVSDSDINKFDQTQSFKILRYKRAKNYFYRAFLRVKQSLNQILNEKYDLLFLAHSPPAIIGIISKYILGIPYVIMGHGSEFLLDNILRKYYIRQAYNRSHVFFVNSNYTRELAKNYGISKKHIEVIHLGGDVDFYNPDKYDAQILKNKMDLNDKFIVLTVGSITERKDHKTVILAIQQLKEKYHNIHYVIVGSGPLLASLQKYVQDLKLNEYISFAGKVDQNDLPLYYSMCDVFVLNSTIGQNGDVEGFGIVLVEAGLMNKPVIGTKNSGIEEVIHEGENGILVEMNNPSQTASAIELFVNDPQFANRIGNNGRQLALEIFTFDATAKKTLQVILDSLNS